MEELSVELSWKKWRELATPVEIFSGFSCEEVAGIGEQKEQRGL